MKRLFILFGFLLLMSPLAIAESATPLALHLSSAEKVCLAQVTEIDGYKITFTVTEALRGKPDHVFQVTRAGGAEKYTLHSEWLLVSCSYGLENAVGWDEDRPAAWIPGSVTRLGGQIYITDWTARIRAGEQLFGVSWDKMPDGTRCLTLDHIQRILQQDSKKSE